MANLEDVEIYNEVKIKIQGIELVDKDKFILCLVHFKNTLDSEKFYYLLYKYKFKFILKKKIDFNYDIAIEILTFNDIVISDSERNKINYKPFKRVLDDGALIKITTGIVLNNVHYLEMGKYIDADNLIVVQDKNLLN